MEGALVKEDLVYRLLPSTEWARLVPIFGVLDWFLPPPFMATAAVAENQEGDIVGIQMLQLMFHGEPTWEHPDYKGKVYLPHLASLIEALPKNPQNQVIMPGFIIIAESDNAAELAKLAGFTEVPGRVFKKDWRK